MNSCDCEPYTIEYDDDEPDVIDHEAYCPRYYNHLHTAEDIAVFRQCIMIWSERADGLGGDAIFLNHRVVAAKMAIGVTARAVELGLERP